MLERPVPKNARIGVIGFAVVLVIGSVLLPMAKGNTQIRNRVQLDNNGKPIVTHTIYMWGDAAAQSYELEDKTYRDVRQVVGRISELMKKNPFLHIRLITEPEFMREQGPIDELGKLCREIGFINMEFDYTLSLSADASGVLLPMIAAQQSTDSGSKGDKIQQLSYDDGASDGKSSVVASGHAVIFESPGGRILKSVKIFGSRYGYPRPPAESFHIWLCDEDFNVIKDFKFPYSKFERSEPEWVTLEVEPTELPEKFVICAGFNPERTKGVYVHYDNNSSGHSFKGLPGEKLPRFDEGDWMIRAVVADAETQRKPKSSSTSRARMQELKYDDGSSDGKKSIAGSAHGVIFEAPVDKCTLKSVKIYGSRYGTPRAPKEDFHIWVCDAQRKVIKDIQMPYSRFTRGNPKWVTLRTPAVELPEEFIIVAGFNAEQTKGVYVHYDSSGSGNSLTGLPAGQMDVFSDGEWMIRAVIRLPGDVAQSGGGMQAMLMSSGPKEKGASGLQHMINAARAGSTVTIPEGIYKEPVKINKSLTLKGESLKRCVFEVTANEPAIFVDTKGKGKVTIEQVTLKWQLATSDKGIENPWAVLVKDSRAEVKGCRFESLGNPQRSPVGLRVQGFSDATVDSCYFKGFDYVVQFGEGTKGTLQDSVIQDCGHQGVINYSNSTMTVQRNIITGSGYHAVRSTGGTLNVKDNLLIANRNRGIYLGNKSCKGLISNNLIIDSGTGIGGFARARVKIENNVIAKASYAGIGSRSSCQLTVTRNIFTENARGIAVFLEEGQTTHSLNIAANTFWQNETDTENCDMAPGSLDHDPLFKDPQNGDYSLKPRPALDSAHGLKNTEVIKELWKKYRALRR